jgi:hypothetical protein
MKVFLSLATLALAATAQAFTLIPNGDFSAGNANWATADGGGVIFNFATSGGNGGGYASMDASNGQWAVLVSPFEPGAAGGGIPISSLGLTAGQSYTFQMDMITLSGTGTGGLKIEAWAGNALVGNSGDLRNGTASGSWSTFSYNYTLPANTEKLILVPLWGFNSNVGYDNIGVVGGAPIPEPSTYAALVGMAALGFAAQRRRRR